MAVNEFLVDLVEWGDAAGLGLYEIGHYRQHRDYANSLAAQGIFIQDYPIMHFAGANRDELAMWLNLHETLHAILRGYGNITGTDLSQLNPQSQEAFYDWQAAHAFEHAAMDNVFGGTP